jgi:NADH-quinone oxidoreductase subunit N
MNMNLVDIAALGPLGILLVGCLLLLLIAAFAGKRTSSLTSWTTIGTLIFALISAWEAPKTEHPLITSWMRFDAITHFFTLFFLLIGLAITLLSRQFFKRFYASQGEYHFLLLASLFGLILIGASADFLTLFIGLETLSIALYVLCGYMKGWQLSHESAAKYFLIGSIAAAILLYGIALIYGAVGTTSFGALLAGYHGLDQSSRFLFLIGISLVTVGLGFKAAIVPFHNWAPDVYDGAPSPVTAFMAVGTKVGAFAALLRIFLEALPQFDPLWNQGILLLACLTLIYANLVAIRQTHLRRFFAYSGISHAGFLLIPLVVGTAEAIPPLLAYMTVYAFATIGAFAVLIGLDKDSKGIDLQDLTGLFRHRPLYAALFALCLLTLAGIPPTIGFFAKFYLFKVAFEAGHITLVIVALLTAILAAYYYLRIISIMLTEGDRIGEHAGIRSYSHAIVAVVAFIGILLLSIMPGLILQ